MVNILSNLNSNNPIVISVFSMKELMKKKLGELDKIHENADVKKMSFLPIMRSGPIHNHEEVILQEPGAGPLPFKNIKLENQQVKNEKILEETDERKLKMKMLEISLMQKITMIKL